MSLTDDFLKGLQKRGVSTPTQKSNKQTSSKVTAANDLTSDFLTGLQKRKKKQLEEEDIAPVFTPVPKPTVKGVTTGKEDLFGLDLFQKGSFEDGFDWSDVPTAILGTAGDALLGAAKGFFGVSEGLADLIAYGAAGVGDLVGKDEWAEGVRKRASENVIDYVTKDAEEYLDQYSILGNTSGAVMQGLGQVGAIAATGGLGAAGGLGAVGTTVLTTGVMGASGMGSGMGEAYQGGATDEEALEYGLIAGASDALSELMFGGLGKGVNALGFSKGLSSADDMLAKAVSNKFKSQITKNFAEFGIKASAEGMEEVVAGVAQAMGKKATYMSEEEFGKILQDENLLEQFIVGSVTSGIMQSGIVPGMKSGSLAEANKNKTDFITGYSQNEQAVIQKEIEKRIAEVEADGKTLSKKEKAAIEAQVEKDLEKGYISIDTIEETLGGDTYKSYKETADREDAILTEYEELGKKERPTLKDQARYAELTKQIEEINNTSNRNALKQQLSDEVFGLAMNDRLAESYNERSRRGQAFEADLSQYEQKQQDTIKKAVDSGILNNTNRTHEFVDMIAKISADKGVLFDFTNNEKLKDSSFAVDGKQVNGFVTKDGVTLNINSAKALEKVVGHEITHVLEGTDLYTELQNTLVEYAKSKGDYQGRYDSLKELYKDVKDADIDAELTADLVGDYLFTDTDFVNSLSTNHRNIFQKIYDEIKYLCKVATAGSKEARELEKVKRIFEKTYQESAVAVDGTNYSIVQTSKMPYADQLMKIESGKMNGSNSLYIGKPSNQLRDVGFSDAPFAINQSDYRKSRRASAKNKNYSSHDVPYDFFENMPQHMADAPMLIDNGQKVSVITQYGMKDTKGQDSFVIAGVWENQKMESDTVNIVKSVYPLDDFVARITKEAEGGKLVLLNKNKAEQMLATIGIQPSEVSRIVSLAKGSLSQQNENVKKYSLSAVADVQPTSDKWQRTLTTEEAKARFPKLWDVTADESEVRNPTQIARTVGTYRRIYDHLAKEGFDGTILDASSGLGYGTRAGIEEYGFDVEDIEPYPDNDYKPKYTDYSQLDKKYDAIISSFVLNVLPQDQRDALVAKMGEMLNDGGRMFVNVRGNDVETGLSKSGKNIKLGDMEWIETTRGSYQKGFKKAELVAYLKDALGNGFTVEPTSLQSPVAAIVTKKPSVQYSLSDSDGKQLSKGQQEYFKNSKMRDENGNLKVMYHGSQDAGFHEFNGNRSDDGISFFFVDRNDVASSYSGTSETYEARAIRTTDDFVNFLTEIGESDYEVTGNEESGYFILDVDGDTVAESGNLQDLYEEYCDYMGIGYGDANYKVYLNLTNPLVVDAEGRNWNNISREFSQEVYDRYKSLTEQENAALADLAGWGDFGAFDDAIHDAIYKINREWEGIAPVTIDENTRALADAYKKLTEAKPTVSMYDIFNIAQDNFSEESLREFAVQQMNTRDYANKAKEQGYDGVIFNNIVDIGQYGGDYNNPATVAVAFDSSQIKSTANENPTADPDIRYSLSEGSIEQQINESLTMKEAQQMIQRAFVIGNIYDWHDGEYKNGDEWLKGQGAEDVAMVVENEYSLQQAYLDRIEGLMNEDFSLIDILDAYSAGTLTGKTKKQIARVNTADGVRVSDERFYAPKEIENAKSLYEVANQRLTKGNSEEVTKARAAILLYAHNKGAAETLGITDSELNKKLRSWGGYSAQARVVSQHINEGVHASNRWTGIESVSWLNKSTVSNDEVARMVKSVEGDADTYQTKYIARTMLSLDTHIDWSWLNFKFDTHSGVNEASTSGRCNGYYRDSSRLVHVKRDAPNTVAHEMGHALDHQWGRDLGYNSPITEISRNTERISGEARVWFDSFKEFADGLVAASDLRSEYSMDVKETFARFVSKFVEWTEQIGTGKSSGYESNWYNDKFTTKQFIEFARLLQEKSAIDSRGLTENKFSLSEQGETHKEYGSYNVYSQNGRFLGKDLELAPVAEEATTPVIEKPAKADDIAPVDDARELFPDEQTSVDAELDRLNQRRADLEQQLIEAVYSEDADAIERINTEYAEVMAEVDAIEEDEANRRNSLDDSDVPLETEAPYYEREAVTLTKKATDDIARKVRSALGLSNMQMADARSIIEKYRSGEISGRTQLVDELQSKFGTYTEKSRDDLLAEVQNILRSRGVNVSDTIKRGIADYRDVMRKNFGKIRFSKNGLGVDELYKELGSEDMYPSYFPEYIDVPEDQLRRMIEVANWDVNTETEITIAIEDIEAAADEIINSVYDFKMLQDEKLDAKQAKEAFDSLMKNADKYIPEDIAPVKNETPSTQKPTEASQKPVQQASHVDTEKHVFSEQLSMWDKEKKQPNPNVAQILETEPDTTPKRRSRAWAKFRAAVVDKGAVFEDLSLKTKNRQLMGDWQKILYAPGIAQNFIGNGEGNVPALTSLMEEVGKSGKEKKFTYYLYHLHNADRMSLAERFPGMENKPVYGDTITSEMSKQSAAVLENANPEFKEWANKIYAINKHNRDLLVEAELITPEIADLWEKMYPHYVPVRREGDVGLNINVPLDSNKTGVNNPVKRATGGSRNILPLFDTMAQRTIQTYRAIAKNQFGVELKNTLGSTVAREANTVDGIIDSIDSPEGLLQEGKDGLNPTFTVFENGERVTYEITPDMYDALKPVSEGMKYTNKVLGTMGNLHKKLLTEYNPVFMLTNAAKDIQDVLINSQHPVKTYAKIPEAYAQIATKGYWYKEYVANGGEQNTYFDSETNKFTKENAFGKVVKFPLNAISAVNNFIEMAPRLAEYIASRENGQSVEVSMLDAARVTTNFTASGDFARLLNRNGCTFLTASISGASQQVRNFREAKANGLKGWMGLATRFAIAGLPAILLNSLMWDDDEEYEELSDYVKRDYYIVGKTEDGKFIRIPKGRTVAVIQSAIEQMGKMVSGDDEADWGAFLELAISNLAPNNPLDNNIIAPIIQTANNKTWYGEDLVPSRLQDVPVAEQYDESTDSISKWLGENLNVSPYKINYLLNQYSGGVGDVVLPMLTPEAESGDDSLMGNLLAPMKDKFTTDGVMNNQNVSDFYDTMDKLKVNSNSMYATDEDLLKYKYMNAVNSDLSELYQQKREIQNSDLSDAEKFEQVRDIQTKIVDRMRESLGNYESLTIQGGNYVEIGGYHFDKDEEGKWWRINDQQLEKQNKVTEALGISPSDYWSNREEYNYAYEKPEQYQASRVCGGYDSYRAYQSDLWDIKADKDKNGKSIIGSRKEKVIDYVNNLDADYGTKIILFKNEYNADDTYNYEIIDYLNSRDDISYEEMETILKYLGFEVDSKGNITW